MLMRCAALALAFTAIVAPAKADAVTDFYKGKNIQLVVGYGPGGGYDIYARLIARFIGKHVPGSPGRRLSARGQLSLCASAPRWHGDWHIRTQYAAHGRVERQSQCAI